MNLVVKTSRSNTAPKLTYDVLIENQQDGTFKATLLGLPDCQALGNTETAAIETLIQGLQSRLETAKIITVEIPATEVVENPWLKFAGMFKDDPLFDEVLSYIEAERSELDAQMEEYYRQIDGENKTK